MNHKNIIVTGASGLLGKSFTSFLKNKYPQSNVFEFKRENFVELESELLKASPDYIFHFAGSTGNDWTKLYDSNISTTIALFEASLKLNRNVRIVMPGSAAEFGVFDQDIPISEETPVNPISNYGEIKKWQSSLAQLYSQRGLNIVVGRIFNVIAPDLSQKTLIGDFIAKIGDCRKDPETNLVVGNFESVRDFLYVEDICTAFVELAKSAKAGEFFHICSGEGVRIGRLFELMTQKFQVEPKLEFDPKIDQQVNFNYGSNQKILKQTNWQPRFNLEKSIEQLDI